MDFKKWLFEKRDIDGLIIAFIVSNAISGFIRDFTDGVVNPILIGILPSNSETDTQTLNINNTLNKIQITIALVWYIESVNQLINCIRYCNVCF